MSVNLQAENNQQLLTSPFGLYRPGRRHQRGTFQQKLLLMIRRHSTSIADIIHRIAGIQTVSVVNNDINVMSTAFMRDPTAPR